MKVSALRLLAWGLKTNLLLKSPQKVHMMMDEGPRVPEAKPSRWTRHAARFSCFTLAAVSAIAVAQLASGRTPAGNNDWGDVQGISDLSDGIDRAAAWSSLLPLTFHDGEPDIIFAGAPECTFCRAYVEDGLEDLVSYAEGRNLDLLYMPLAMTGYGVSVNALEHCALPLSGNDGASILHAGYQAIGKLDVIFADPAQQDPEAQLQRAEDVMAELRSGLDVTSSALPAEGLEGCERAAATDIGGSMQQFAAVFDMRALPSFFVDLGNGRVRRIEGALTPEMLDAMLGK